TVSAVQTVIGLALITATALAAEALRPRYPAVAPTRPAAGAPLDVGLIDAMLAGLPGPGGALDRDRIRGALHQRAARVAPARGAAASRRRSRCACPKSSPRSARPSRRVSRSAWNSPSACRSIAGTRPM